MRLAFDLDQGDFGFYFGVIIDSAFMFDILLNFNTGFFLKGEKIMERASIAKDYFKLWFWIDLFSSIPYTWIIAAAVDMAIQDIDSDVSAEKVLSKVNNNNTTYSLIDSLNSSYSLNDTTTSSILNPLNVT